MNQSNVVMYPAPNGDAPMMVRDAIDAWQMIDGKIEEAKRQIGLLRTERDALARKLDTHFEAPGSASQRAIVHGFKVYVWTGDSFMVFEVDYPASASL